MDKNNVYENIVNHFRDKGLADDEIALNILKDNIQMPLLDFALENLSEEEAFDYYEQLQEDLEDEEEL